MNAPSEITRVYCGVDGLSIHTRFPDHTGLGSIWPSCWPADSIDAMLAMLMPRTGTTRMENPPKISFGLSPPSPPDSPPPGNPGSPPPNGSPEGTNDPGPEPPEVEEAAVVDSVPPPPPPPGTMPDNGPFAIMSWSVLVRDSSTCGVSIWTVAGSPLALTLRTIFYKTTQSRVASCD